MYTQMAYAIKQTPYAFVAKIILCMYLFYANNNWFQKKLVGHNTYIWIYTPPPNWRSRYGPFETFASQVARNHAIAVYPYAYDKHSFPYQRAKFVSGHFELQPFFVATIPHETLTELYLIYLETALLYRRQSTRWSQKHGGRVTTPSNKSPSYLLEWTSKV